MNSATRRFSSHLLDFVRADMKLFKLSQADMASIARSSYLRSKTAGLLQVLLSSTEGMSTADAARFVSSGKEVIAHPCSIKDLSKLSPPHAPRILVLDEVPTFNSPLVQWTKEEFRFLRNLCRIAGLKLLLMGTDSTIANLVDAAQATRCAPTAWSVVIHHLAPFSPTPAEEAVLAAAPPIVADVIRRTNPWFARIAIKHLTKSGEAHRSDASLLQSIAADIFQTVVCEKGIHRTGWSSGQVRLQLASTQPNSIDHCLISGHFARLAHPGWVDWWHQKSDAERRLEEERQRLAQNPTDTGLEEKIQALESEVQSLHLRCEQHVLEDVELDVIPWQGLVFNKKNWRPKSKFPGADVDPLLYIALGGLPGMSPYCVNIDNLAQSPSAAAALFAAFPPDTQHAFDHEAALARNGQELEVRATLALQRASRYSALEDGSCIDDFVRRTFGELLESQKCTEMSWTTGERVSDVFPAVSGMDAIPWLCGPGSHWPPELLAMTDLDKKRSLFGYLGRTSNSSQRDMDIVTVSQGGEFRAEKKEGVFFPPRSRVDK